jgi:hypothetical protein
LAFAFLQAACPGGEIRPAISLREESNMALITDIVTFGTAIGTVIFTLWMIKQLFTDKS